MFCHAKHFCDGALRWFTSGGCWLQRSLRVLASMSLFSIKTPLSFTHCNHFSSSPLPPFLCLGVTLSNKDGRPKRRINHVLRLLLLSEQLARGGGVTDLSAESIRLARRPRSALFLKSVNRPQISRFAPLTGNVTIVRPSAAGRKGSEAVVGVVPGQTESSCQARRGPSHLKPNASSGTWTIEVYPQLFERFLRA